MRDIQYFIDKETDYCQRHEHKDEMYFDEECGEFLPKRYADDFLQGGWLTKFSLCAHTPEMETAIKRFNLNESETVILLSFLGNLSQYFRDDTFSLFGEVPEVAKEMQLVLDSMISKAPLHEGEPVYRFLNSNDEKDLETGDIIEIKHSLTTTTDDWEKETDSYSIIPLPKDKTKARDIYKILNHRNENQVNFQRGAKFKVLSVTTNTDNNCKRINLKEIE